VILHTDRVVVTHDRGDRNARTFSCASASARDDKFVCQARVNLASAATRGATRSGSLQRHASLAFTVLRAAAVTQRTYLLCSSAGLPSSHECFRLRKCFGGLRPRHHQLSGRGSRPRRTGVYVVYVRLRPCGGAGQAKPATPHQRQFAAGTPPQRGCRAGAPGWGPAATHVR